MVPPAPKCEIPSAESGMTHARTLGREEAGTLAETRNAEWHSFRISDCELILQRRLESGGNLEVFQRYATLLKS